MCLSAYYAEAISIGMVSTYQIQTVRNQYLPIHSWFIGLYLNVSVGIGGIWKCWSVSVWTVHREYKLYVFTTSMYCLYWIQTMLWIYSNYHFDAFFGYFRIDLDIWRWVFSEHFSLFFKHFEFPYPMCFSYFHEYFVIYRNSPCFKGTQTKFFVW